VCCAHRGVVCHFERREDSKLCSRVLSVECVCRYIVEMQIKISSYARFFFGDCGHMVRTMVEMRLAVCWDNRLILVFAIHSTVFLISKFFG
jgi:hypothetical protein